MDDYHGAIERVIMFTETTALFIEFMDEKYLIFDITHGIGGYKCACLVGKIPVTVKNNNTLDNAILALRVAVQNEVKRQKNDI